MPLPQQDEFGVDINSPSDLERFYVVSMPLPQQDEFGAPSIFLEATGKPWRLNAASAAR